MEKSIRKRVSIAIILSVGISGRMDYAQRGIIQSFHVVNVKTRIIRN
jgi:hypothetical protein